MHGSNNHAPGQISVHISLYEDINCSKKGMHFWVHGPKNPCTRGLNHAPRVQGAPLISDTVMSRREHGDLNGAAWNIRGGSLSKLGIFFPDRNVTA